MCNNFAPVFIPTLNRYDHFRECLESLGQCTGCQNTEVYIALDYPPSEKYVEGWKKIDEYLRRKEKNHPFKKLLVVRRERNYGVLKKNDNISTLIDEYAYKYDSYIFSEDDNVFSKNFLEYMNKGLTKYKDDSNVMAICGYTQPYEFKFSGNNHFRHNTDVSAWGIGYFSTKSSVMFNKIENGFFRKSLSVKNVLKVKKHGYNRLFQYIKLCFHYKYDFMPITDCVYTVYIILNNMQVICPSLTKVRNMGWDETGNSFNNNPRKLKRYQEVSKRHNQQEIDENAYFDYRGDDWAYFDYNNQLTAEYSEGKISLIEFMLSTTIYMVKYIAKIIGVKKIL